MSARSVMASRMAEPDEPVAKKKKASTEQVTVALPSSMIVEFVGDDGGRAGATEGTLDLPLNSTPKQLELLVNSLLQVL